MIQRTTRKLKFLTLQSRIKGLDQFRKIKPFDQLTAKIIAQNKEMLRPYYEEYIRVVSRADMAASLELAAVMYTTCKLNGYTRLLDTGSGLSSFVFRLYARETAGVTVYSVDDDPEWLGKTKDFLLRHKLDIQNIFTLEQFLKLNVGGFDCILHDLNFVEVRIKHVEKIMKVARPGGLIVFDDVHKPDYLFPLLVQLKNLRARVFTLKLITLDNYGRFSLAAVNHI